MPFDGVEIELGLVRGATDAPLVYLRRDDAALVGLLLVQWAAHLLVDLQLRRRAHLGVLLVRSLALVRWSKLILLRRRLSWRCHVHLLAIATSLRPSLDLVLDLFLDHFLDWYFDLYLDLLLFSKKYFPKTI